MESHPTQPTPADGDTLARAIARSTGGGPDGRPSGEQLRETLRLAGASARAAGARAVTSGRWLAEVSIDVAGHLPVRDLATLRAHHGGLSGSLLARPLVRNASLTSAGVGAATGALAAAAATNPAGWATLPAQLAAETLVVVAVEMKLVGELHEAAGYPLAGDLRRNGPLIARAWAESRGLEPAELARLLRPGQAAAMTSAASDLLGRSARDQLTLQIRRRLVRRAGRNTATLVPLMAGAVAGGELNRRATRKLGRSVATTLRIPPP